MSWTTITTPVSVTKTAGWNGSYWVLGGQSGNTFATSTDNGVTWIGRGSTSVLSLCNCITWGNSLWVAGGYIAAGGNGIATSSDGITWTGRAAGIAERVTCIGWNGSIFVAGCNSSSSFRIITSSDGITWTGRSTSAVGNAPTSVICDGSKWMMLASATPYLAYSYDGISWTGKSAFIQLAGLETRLGGNYPTVVKLYDKSVQSNNSTFYNDDLKLNFSTTRQLT